MNNNDLKISSGMDPKEFNRGLALDFLQILIKYGKLSTGFSYGIEQNDNVSGDSRYRFSSNKIRSVLSKLFYSIFLVYQTSVVIHYKFTISYSLLVNCILRITYGLFAVKLIIVQICLEQRGRKQGLWIQILEQADIIQQKLASFDIHFPSRRKVRIFGSMICIVSFLICCVHMTVFTFSKGKDRSAKVVVSTMTFHRYNLDTESVNSIIVYGIAGVRLLSSIFIWNLWYFTDALRVFSSLVVWMVFRKINFVLESKKLTLDSLPDVIDLHFKGVKLLNLFNQLISPVTFVSTLFNITYACFWTNFTLISFEFKPTHIVGVITVIRMIAVFYITADVNTQAYRISTWLENSFSEIDTSTKIDKGKLTLFTSLIYSRDSIGFKGLHFFTTTPALNSAIAGLVMTYTVVVNQFVNQ